MLVVSPTPGNLQRGTVFTLEGSNDEFALSRTKGCVLSHFFALRFHSSELKTIVLSGWCCVLVCADGDASRTRNLSLQTCDASSSWTHTTC